MWASSGRVSKVEKCLHSRGWILSAAWQADEQYWTVGQEEHPMKLMLLWSRRSYSRVEYFLTYPISQAFQEIVFKGQSVEDQHVYKNIFVWPNYQHSRSDKVVLCSARVWAALIYFAFVYERNIHPRAV